MVTLFGDRISWPLLAQFSRMRESFNSTSDRPAGAAPVSSVPAEGTVHSADALRTVERAINCQPRHAAGLSRVRHIWYRGAVAHDPAYDAHYFVKTGEWVEPRCGDSECGLCKERPERHTAL